jgi:hypothetical protein
MITLQGGKWIIAEALSSDEMICLHYVMNAGLDVTDCTEVRRIIVGLLEKFFQESDDINIDNIWQEK